MAFRTTCRRAAGLLEHASGKEVRPFIIGQQCGYATTSSSSAVASSSSSSCSATTLSTTTRRPSSSKRSQSATPTRFISPCFRQSASFSTSLPRTREQQQGRSDAESSLTPLKTTQEVQSWFRENFEHIQLPDAIALQLITHESWDNGTGVSGHNRRLSFLGRRAMHMFLSLFLLSNLNPASSASSTSSGSSPVVAQLLSSNDELDKLLQTSRLGDGVGRALGLEEVMRWKPALSDGQFGPKETGLFKIRGVAVEALIGAIYHQHGAAAARGFFDSRVLPRLESFPGNARQELSSAIDRASQAGEVVLASLPRSPLQQSSSSPSSSSLSSVASSSSAPSSPSSTSSQQHASSSSRSHRDMDDLSGNHAQERWTLAV